ncbi:MAG: class I SAM-dependent methyltransferase [Proteobacteria bacterium]|nr:class I SAM-dependent methyltransferase [Pseudomonadota bacterium]MBU1715343.1 class I SAM-dependent methyltransferase [Pseudomonadota bacterium]
MAQHVCPWWLAYTFDNPLRRFLHRPAEIFDSHLQEGMTVLDLGCGMGYFSIAMAGIVGDSGQVISVDLQEKMLAILKKRAIKAGLANRIAPVQCTEENVGVTEKADFALAFWMVHETPSQKRFLSQVFALLKESGKMLIAEPRMHVTVTDFEKTLDLATRVGFKEISCPKVRWSRAVLLQK